MIRNVGKWNGIDVVVKKLNKPPVDLTFELRMEMKTIRELRHPNLVGFVGASIDAPCVCILSELVPKVRSYVRMGKKGGSLFIYLLGKSRRRAGKRRHQSRMEFPIFLAQGKRFEWPRKKSHLTFLTCRTLLAAYNTCKRANWVPTVDSSRRTASLITDGRAS